MSLTAQPYCQMRADGEKLALDKGNRNFTVITKVALAVDLGNGQLLNHAFEVLDGALNPCILGCDLLAKFDATEFYRQNMERLTVHN